MVSGGGEGGNREGKSGRGRDGEWSWRAQRDGETGPGLKEELEKGARGDKGGECKSKGKEADRNVPDDESGPRA